MQTVISFAATASPELGRVLSAYLALDRARMLRRLMVVRFGLLALFAGSIETIFRGFSSLVRVFTIALCLVPPLCARIVDLVRLRRLSQRGDLVDGVISNKIVPRSLGGQACRIRKS
jgi:hypothetical protein